MKIFIFGMYLKIASLIRSIKTVSNIHLMDDVVYDGKSCFVNNGIHYPKYDLCEKKFNSDGTRNAYLVHMDDFRKVFSIKNLKNGLFYYHDWYMMYWYKVDLDNMMRG